jgi:hypothetical protein
MDYSKGTAAVGGFLIGAALFAPYSWMTFVDLAIGAISLFVAFYAPRRVCD